MVCVQLRVRKLVESAREADDLAIPLHATDGCGRNPGLLQLGESHETMGREEIAGLLALRWVCGHRYFLSHLEVYGARFRITSNNLGEVMHRTEPTPRQLEAKLPLIGISQTAERMRGKPSPAAEPAVSPDPFCGETLQRPL
ncbi:hypothetical protein RHIZ404_220380 [Rhizobium sp. EC-SD404]|nr:hypothetical protein RHIZ404_220380 [Rhizobium sp. EC-SD404]